MKRLAGFIIKEAVLLYGAVQLVTGEIVFVYQDHKAVFFKLKVSRFDDLPWPYEHHGSIGMIIIGSAVKYNTGPELLVAGRCSPGQNNYDHLWIMMTVRPRQNHRAETV